MKKFSTFGILLMIAACSSTEKQTSVDTPNEDLLAREGISQRAKAPQFPYEKFYKTSGISDFEFAPDNQSLYFLKSDGKVKNVFQYNFDSKATDQVTFYREPVTTFKAGKKNRYLYVQKDVGGSEVYDLHRFDLKSKKTVALTRGKNIERSYLCDLNKAGDKLYYSQSRNTRSEYDLKEMNLASLKSRTLKRGNGEMLYCDTLNKEATVLSFQKFVNNNERHIGFVDLASLKSWYILTEKGINNHSFVFHGDNFYFLSTKGSDKTRLWKHSFEEKSLELVDIGLDNDLHGIGVFADGKISTVSYRGQLQPKLAIYDGLFESVRSMDGSVSKDLGLAKFSDSDAGLGIVSVENSYTPSQYYLLRGSETTKIYDSNQSGISNEHFAKSHSRFVKSFDGLNVPVHYFIPNGTSSTDKKPALFWIHGGPEDHVDPVYSPRIQYLVNRGFVVVAPNVRGSTGFGKAYQFKDNSDWGGGHIKDIVKVAEFTKKLSFVDESNVFIVGGSFGGFSVMSTITQYPKVFKAAVNIFGLVEMATFMESWPPVAQKYWISEMGKDPRKDESFNKRLSPIYHVQNIKAPLQIHQGANDIRVPKSQSDMLVERMKKYGLKVDYQIYPDEGHGFLKFANSKRCFEEIAGFLNSQVN